MKTIPSILRILTLLIGLTTSSALSDILFLRCMEADNYRIISQKVTLFSKYADLEEEGKAFMDALDRAIRIPGKVGFSENEGLRIFTVADTSKKLTPDNPGTVVFIPLRASRDSVLKAFRKAYRQEKPLPRISGHLYTGAVSTHTPPSAAIAFTGLHAITAPSEEILQWAWKNREQLIHAPNQNIEGDIRLLLIAPRCADLLEYSAPALAAVPHLQENMRAFSTLLLSFSLNIQNLEIKIEGRPLPGSKGEKAIRSWQFLHTRRWAELPEPSTRLFSLLSARLGTLSLETFSTPPYTRLLEPVRFPDPKQCGDSPLLCLYPTEDDKGLMLVRTLPLKPGAYPSEMCSLPEGKPVDGLVFTRLKGRSLKNGTEVARYRVSLPKRESSKREIAPTILSLLLHHAVLEASVTDKALVTVWGPDRADLIEQALRALRSPAPRISLDRKIRVEIPRMERELFTAGGSIYPIRLLKKLASITPSIPERFLDALPRSGDGIRWAMTKGAETDSILLAISVTTDEISNFQRVIREMRPALQEIFLSLIGPKIEKKEN